MPQSVGWSALGAVMFLTGLLRFLLGSVRFRAEGGSIPLFLTLCARAHIPLWNLRARGGVLEANVRGSHFRRLAPVAAKAGLRVEPLARRGLPAQIARHRARWGFALGFLLFFGVLCTLSGFIWTVDVEGNRDVQTREILFELDSLGLRPGVRADALDLRQTEQEALLALPGLSWMHINLKGTAATVEVGERTTRPDVIPESQPCDVKALETGQIVRMQVFQGQTSLRPGDTVLKGALLVSGTVQEPKSGVTRTVHARAVFIARTQHTLAVAFPLRGVENRDTGHVEKRYSLQLLSALLPLYRSEPAGNFRRSIYTSPLRLGPLTLPVALHTAVFSEYRAETAVYTPAQARAKADALLAQKEKTELAGMKILKRSVQARVSKTGVTLVCTYACEQDIAYETPAGA